MSFIKKKQREDFVRLCGFADEILEESYHTMNQRNKGGESWKESWIFDSDLARMWNLPKGESLFVDVEKSRLVLDKGEESVSIDLNYYFPQQVMNLYDEQRLEQTLEITRNSLMYQVYSFSYEDLTMDHETLDMYRNRIFQRSYDVQQQIDAERGSEMLVDRCNRVGACDRVQDTHCRCNELER